MLHGATKLSTILTGLAESAGKETRQHNPPFLSCPWDKVGGQDRGRTTYLRPKDSNAAFGVRDRASQKMPETNCPRIKDVENRSIFYAAMERLTVLLCKIVTAY